jgi:NAD-dependent dihydropyrimidine dehydrogenase PreA subunit
MEVCPTESITIIDGKAHINPEDCIDCEACIETCPNKAITMVEE